MADAAQKKNILVIEDDSLLRAMIVNKLREEAYDVSEAVMGEDGLEQMAKNRPVLVLLDLLLPQMDGFAVLEKIKSDEKLKDIPVIILSNFGQASDIERGLAMGAAAYLIKANVNPREVIELVRATLKT